MERGISQCGQSLQSETEHRFLETLVVSREQIILVPEQQRQFPLIGGVVEVGSGHFLDVEQDVFLNLSVRVRPILCRLCSQRDGVAPHAHEGFVAFDLRLPVGSPIVAVSYVAGPVVDDVARRVLVFFRGG